MAVEYIEEKILAEGTRTGMVIYRPKDLIAGKKYPLIIFHPGIGEQGIGDAASLEQLRANGSVSQLEAGARVHEFIIAEVQPLNNYEHHETDEAYDYMKARFDVNINWLKVYLTGLSLGGGGTYRYLAEHPDAEKKFAAASPMCAGPLIYFVVEKYWPTLVNTKVPIWAFHNKGDQTAPPEKSTLLFEKRRAEMNGTAKQYTTIYLRDGHTWPAYGFYGTIDAATPTNAEGFNKTVLNMYEWFLLNEVGKPPVYPDFDPSTVPVPIPDPVPDPIPDPTPIPVPEPPKDPIWIKGIWAEGIVNSPIKNAIVKVYFEDGTDKVYRAAKGDYLTGIWISKDSKGHNTVNLTYKIARNTYTDRKGRDY